MSRHVTLRPLRRHQSARLTTKVVFETPPLVLATERIGIQALKSETSFAFAGGCR
jgi:hypothetical protein